MKDSTKLYLKRPIKWYNRELKTDFKKIFISISKSIIMFKSTGVSSGFKELLDSFNSFELKKDSSGLAYILYLTGMINAAHDLIIENKDYFKNFFLTEDGLINNDEYANFLNNMNQVLENKDIFITLDTLKNPKSLPFLSDFCEYFSKWLVFLKIDKSIAITISNRLPAYFVLSLNEEWQNSNDYNLITQKLSTPMTSSARQELNWKRYISFLQQQIELPIFEEPFSLRQIYIPLRAYYLEKVKNNINRNFSLEEDEEENTIKKLVSLDNELDQWLLTKLPYECIKFISGGPGSGKSSFAKIWAASIALKEEIRVLFVPLHLFNIKSSIIDSIGEFVKTYPELRLDYNPLENGEKILIIFDGLDELSKQGNYALEIANQFIESLTYASNFLNRDKEIKVLFLITGRELSIQSNTYNFKKYNQIYFLLPYYIKIDKSWGDKIPISDRLLLEIDQRNDWWSKYGALSGKHFNTLPVELKQDKLDEVTAQPLLNYLMALSLERGKISFSTSTNLNDIYADLIEGVHDRAYEPHRKYKPIEKLDLNDFKRMLEEIALSAWHGGDVRTTSISRIEQHIKDNNLKPLLDKFKKDASKGIIQLLTAFYFREYGIENSEQTFEFTHKSFGEYLTATRLVKKLRQLSKQLQSRKINYDEGLNEEKSLELWLELTGETAIDKYLYSFIKDEILNYDKIEVENWQNTLIDLIAWVLHNGMPMTKVRKSHKEETRITRNASEALLIFLGACASSTNKISNINMPSSDAFGSWLRTLNLQRFSSENPQYYECLSHLDLSNLLLYNQDFYKANLSHCDLNNSSLDYSLFLGANLIESDLSNTQLSESNLSSANMTRANLHSAVMIQSKLANANLSGSNLREADLKGSDLYKANLSECDLTQAVLSNCNISNSNFIEANLTESIIAEAVLTESNFSNSILINASITDSDLTMSIFTKSDLTDADLNGSNLDNTNFSQAILNGVELRRAHITSAVFSKALINNANFFRSNLSGSTFDSAEMCGANFKHSILINANFTGSDLSETDFDNADLRGAVFDRVDFTNAHNLFYNQLTNVRTLRNCTGLKSDIRAALEDSYPRAVLRFMIQHKGIWREVCILIILLSIYLYAVILFFLPAAFAHL